MNKIRNRKGFTLLELIIVIAILAILVSILIPSLFDMQDAAKKSVLVSDMRNIELSIQLYSVTREEGPNTNPPNSGTMTDLQWNAYAKTHLDEYFVGGWPTNTPFGGYYTYRAYPALWGPRNNWKRLSDNQTISTVVTNHPFEIIMLRFVNPSNQAGFLKTKEAIMNSPYQDRVYQYGSQYTLGILVIYD